CAVRSHAGVARRRVLDRSRRRRRRPHHWYRHGLDREPAATRLAPGRGGGLAMRTIVLLLIAFTVSVAALAQHRFDFKVREDMFEGMDGNKEAFDRAMKLIADTLAAEPDHAEALVWRGDGRLFLAGQAFQRGAIAEGQKLAAEAIADMDRAVSLAPDKIAVRV